MYLFYLGWRRELVKCGYTGERYVNVYYHTPNDKKLKTPQEVAKYCKYYNNVRVFNFYNLLLIEILIFS